MASVCNPACKFIITNRKPYIHRYNSVSFFSWAIPETRAKANAYGLMAECMSAGACLRPLSSRQRWGDSNRDKYEYWFAVSLSRLCSPPVGIAEKRGRRTANDFFFLDKEDEATILPVVVVVVGVVMKALEGSGSSKPPTIDQAKSSGS